MDYMTFISENYVAIILGAVIVLMTIIGYFADKKYTKTEPVEKKAKKQKNDVVEEFDTPSDLEPTVNDMKDLSNMDMFNDIPDTPVMEDVKPVPVVNNDSYDNFEDVPEELFEGVKEVNDSVEPSFETKETNDSTEPSFDNVETENVPVDEVKTPEEEVKTNEVEVATNGAVEEEPLVDQSNDVIEPSIDSDNSWSTIEPTSNEEAGVSFDMDETPVDEVTDSEWTKTESTPIEEDRFVDNDNITFDGVADEDFKLPTIDKLNDELSNVDDDDDDVWKF